MSAASSLRAGSDLLSDGFSVWAKLLGSVFSPNEKNGLVDCVSAGAANVNGFVSGQLVFC